MKEADIRPANLFARYLELCRADAEGFFRDDEWEPSGCPACGAAGDEAFTKHRFTYRSCQGCLTLFASPRPTAAALGRYYTEAASVAFWASDFYRQTEAARRELMFRPRAERVRESLAAMGVGPPESIVDIGAGYGVFCEEIQKQFPDAAVWAVEPSAALGDVCRAKGIPVVPVFLEDLEPSSLPPGDGVRVFTSFELFEHLHDPRRFLEHCRRVMRPGDVLVLTTLSGAGFDIQVLWQDARAVFPPHHLNFLNPWSLERLARGCGFADVTVTTPGRLDVDIVRTQLGPLGVGRFLHTLGTLPGAADADLQSWLQARKLSSHMMMIARPGSAPRG